MTQQNTLNASALSNIFATTNDNRSAMNDVNHGYVDFKINENGVELVKRIRNLNSTQANPLPDTVVKEVWEVQDGKLVQTQEVTGKHTPAYVVPEEITFDEQ